MILSNTFPGLLVSVIPLSFEHFPWVPFPLYSPRVWPICQLSGISSFTWILLKASLKISLVFLFASMNIPLGMSSGPRLFFQFLWLFLFPLGIFGLVLMLFVQLFGVFFTSVSMYFVQFSYSGVPGLAWYRVSKYSVMCSFVFSGSVMVVPSSVMVT